MLNSRKYAFSPTFPPQMVQGLRKKLKLTQKDFAQALGVSKKTVERWENDEKGASGAAALLFDLLYEHPEYMEYKKIAEKKYTLRLNYMYHDKICASIDVDEMNRRIEVKNYTDMLIFRPFGSVLNPTYEDYEEFLESRCFPKGRDKIKINLAELGIPFYDPILIIEKTKGRMEDDNFWIDMV